MDPLVSDSPPTVSSFGQRFSTPFDFGFEHLACIEQETPKRFLVLGLCLGVRGWRASGFTVAAALWALGLAGCTASGFGA